MGYLQQYNAQNGITPSSGSTGKVSGGFLTQYNATHKTQPVVKTTSPKKVEPAKTIKIGGITITQPNIKIPNPIEGFANLYKAVTAPPKTKPVEQKPIQIEPKQKKLTDPQIKEIQLANGQKAQVSKYFVPNTTIGQAKPEKKKQSITDMAGQFIDSLFGIKPEERARIKLNDQKAIDMNAYALKKKFPEESKQYSLTDLTKPGGNPFRESPSEEVSKKVLNKLGIGRAPNNKEFLDLMMALSLPVSFGLGAAGLAPSIPTQLMALGKFTAVSTVFDIAFQKLTGKSGISEVLPENTPQGVKVTVDGLELLGKAILSHGLKPGKLTDVFTKETINKYNLPEKFYLKPSEVKDIVGTKDLTSKEQQRVFKDLGLTDAQIEQAKTKGITVEIPSSNIVKVVDRPYWAKLKEKLNMEPVTGEKVAPKGTIKVSETSSTAVAPEKTVKITNMAEVNDISPAGTIKEGSLETVYRKIPENTVSEGGYVVKRGEKLYPTDKMTPEIMKASKIELNKDGSIIENATINKRSFSEGTALREGIPQSTTQKAREMPNKAQIEPKQDNNRITKVSAVGTPKLAEGIRSKAIKNKVIYGFDKTFKDLPEFDRVDVKVQSQKAMKLLFDNPNEAFEIAMGRKQPPNGLLPESVLVAVENYAIETKNVAALRELATHSELTMQATGMGQRIRMLAERNPDSPATAIRNVADARKAAVEKRFDKSLSETTKNITKEIKKKIKPPDKHDWGNFIKNIEC